MILFGSCLAAIGIAVLIIREIIRIQEENYDAQVHRKQQNSLRRFRKMQARDRNEPRYSAWWKSLGVGR